MNDTSQIRYILADTRDEVLNTAPGNGLLAISKDTSSLFVSDGSRWIETNINSKHNIEYLVTSEKSISQSPLLHFDADDQSSIENATGNMVTDNQPIARINSSVSNEAMVSTPTNAPVYIESDLNSNAGILAFGAQGMTPDLNAAEARDGAMTVLCVFTPTANALGLDELGRKSGLERRWDPIAGVLEEQSGDRAAGAFAPSANGQNNRYSFPRITSAQYIINTYSQSLQKHHARQVISNGNTYFYGFHDMSNFTSFPQSHQTTVHDLSSSDPNSGLDQHSGPGNLVDGVVRSDGSPGNRIHHWNQNYLGKPQIISIRVENNKDRNFGTFLKIQLHAWHPHHFETTYPWNIIWSGSTINYSSVINHGLSIGTYNTSYGNTSYSVHASFHEMMYFDKYLPDSDLTILGERLAEKWNTGGSTDTWRL